MAQAVSRQPLTAEAEAQREAIPWGICGGQSGTGTGFCQSTSVSPVSIIPPMLHIHSLTTDTMYSKQLTVSSNNTPKNGNSLFKLNQSLLWEHHLSCYIIHFLVSVKRKYTYTITLFIFLVLHC